MSDIFITDAQKGRAEWLAGFQMTDADVHDDEVGEYVLVEGARVYLPKSIQSENIYN